MTWARRERGRNIVLLRSDSRDGLAMTDAFASAARSLGLEVRDNPDRDTIAILPASDFRALDAAWMARTYGVPGPDPVMVAIATSKSLTYEFLRRKGFSLLRWCVPQSGRDLSVPWRGPVFVKPDAGSGSVSAKPWGYRAFDSLRDFQRFLSRGDRMREFYEAQRDPRQRHLIMEYAPARELWSIATVAGDGPAMLYDTNLMHAMPRWNMIERVLIGAKHPDTGTALRMARALAAAGLRRSVIYLQCVERGGRLYPMDLNLRPGTIWSHCAQVLNVPAHEEILAVLLNLKAGPSIRWPAPYVGVARVPMRGPAQVAAEFRHAAAIPIIERTSFDRSRAFDRGHAWPRFAVLCKRRQDFARTARAVIATTRIRPRRDARSDSRRSARSSPRAG